MFVDKSFFIFQSLAVSLAFVTISCSFFLKAEGRIHSREDPSCQDSSSFMSYSSLIKAST